MIAIHVAKKRHPGSYALRGNPDFAAQRRESPQRGHEEAVRRVESLFLSFPRRA